LDTFDFTKVDISSRKIAKGSKKTKVENRKQGKPIKAYPNCIDYYTKILTSYQEEGRHNNAENQDNFFGLSRQ
jgi:hypothetical protein